jgi:hypothetical protein
LALATLGKVVAVVGISIFIISGVLSNYSLAIHPNFS